MNNFRINVNPKYEHLNFTEDDIISIFKEANIKINPKYNKDNIHLLTSVVIINSVEYFNKVGHRRDDYIFTIEYTRLQEFGNTNFHIYENLIPDFMLYRKRSINLNKLLNE